MRLRPPCHSDQISWDQDPSKDFTPHPPVHQLVHACLTQCPMLDWCRRYDAALPANERPYGVVAGEYRPWPSDSVVVARAASATTMRAVRHLELVAARLAPGDRMPTVPQVMADLAISRNPVRAAFRHLAAKRVLDLPRSRVQPYTVAHPAEERAA